MQGARAPVPIYLYRRTYLRYTGKWVSRKEQKIENLMAGYFWSFMVFFFIGLFLKMPFFKVWRYFTKNYCIHFNGRGTELLEICHSWISMAGKDGNIKNILLNNFKMVKSTKNIKIHKIHVFKTVFSIKKILIFRNLIFFNSSCHNCKNFKQFSSSPIKINGIVFLKLRQLKKIENAIYLWVKLVCEIKNVLRHIIFKSRNTSKIFVRFSVLQA